MTSRSSSGRPERLVVSPEDGGMRLDKLLAREVRGISRSALQRLVRAGGVTIDGVAATRPSANLEAGGELALDWKILAREEQSRRRPSPAAEPVVLFEDEALVVIDKPAGLLTHGNTEMGLPVLEEVAGSVAEWAAACYGELPAGSVPGRAGIVHRLDRETSGVMVIARTGEALRELQRQFREREVEKCYVGLCQGAARFDTEWIETPIGADPKHPLRRRIAPEDDPTGRAARTYYEVRERFHGFVHLECFPKTGRTHQIRVHLASIGMPILFDRTYIQASGLRDYWPHEKAPRMSRHALHAASLELTIPGGERRKFSSELPADMCRVLEYLARERKP